MVCRKMSIGLMIFALALMASAVKADDPPKTEKPKFEHGTFVSITDGNLVVTPKDGPDKTIKLAADVKVLIKGEAGKVDDLKKGKISYKLDASGNVSDIHQGRKSKADASK